jgi:hypothetical protein
VGARNLGKLANDVQRKELVVVGFNHFTSASTLDAIRAAAASETAVYRYTDLDSQ